MPLFGELFDVFFLWDLGERIDPLDGLPDSEVVHGQDVRPAEREKQKHVDRPRADPEHFIESLKQHSVLLLLQEIEIQPALGDLAREILEIAYFLGRNSRFSQLLDGCRVK